MEAVASWVDEILIQVDNQNSSDTKCNQKGKNRDLERCHHSPMTKIGTASSGVSQRPVPCAGTPETDVAPGLGC